MSNFFLHLFFHTKTSDRSEGGLVRVPEDRKDWPDSWKNVSYKKYSLLPAVRLHDYSHEESILHKLLVRRTNQKDIISNALTVNSLSYLLQCGYGLQKTPIIPEDLHYRKENRTVPSAGKLYPLEIYIILFKQVESLSPGIYHYGIKDHVLETVCLKTFSTQERESFAPQLPWLADCTAVFCFTGVFDRTVQKYGSRGYRFILLEAGHVAQNIILAGVERGLQMVPIGGVEEKVFEHMLSLPHTREHVVYSMYV